MRSLRDRNRIVRSIRFLTGFDPYGIENKSCDQFVFSNGIRSLRDRNQIVRSIRFFKRDAIPTGSKSNRAINSFLTGCDPYGIENKSCDQFAFSNGIRSLRDRKQIVRYPIFLTSCDPYWIISLSSNRHNRRARQASYHPRSDPETDLVSLCPYWL